MYDYNKTMITIIMVETNFKYECFNIQYGNMNIICTYKDLGSNLKA